MTETLIVLGVIVLSCALRTTDGWAWRKLGALGFLAATFLTGYFLTGLWWVGAAATVFWFLAPWIELLTRTRNLRLPLKHTLRRKGPPGVGRFPELSEMTSEIEASGFEHVADTGWEWADTHQFFRFLYHGEKRVQAVICFSEQPAFSWACINLTSRHEDGRIYRSTNLPFSNPMKSAPNVKLRRNWKASNFEEFFETHETWLDSCGCRRDDLIEQSPDDLFDQVEEETGRQIDHNAKSGIISICEEAETWRYSWRGLCYVYVQVLKDMVKWS